MRPLPALFLICSVCFWVMGCPSDSGDPDNNVTENSTPYWDPLPSGVTIAAGQIYNLANGRAMDSDRPSQRLTCESTGDTCSFDVNVSGMDAGEVNCNIRFTAGDASETCEVKVTVIDSEGATISHTLPIIVTEVMHTGAGSLAGVVTFPGALPTLEDLPITKDNDTCGKGKKPSERLIVSGNKEVANTVVRLTNVSSTKQLDIPSEPFYLDQKQCGFHPHIQVVPVGGKLAIKNSDNVLHNVHGFIGTKTAFNLAMPLENQIIPKKMKAAGIIRLKCDAGHVWMNGYIVVADHPYVALTDEKGKYEITDIPPGKYKVEFWHEGWKIAKINPDGSVAYSDPIVSVKDVTITAEQKSILNFELKGR